MDLPNDRYGRDGLTPRVWQLLEVFSACDATYVALAQAITEDGAPLLTADGRLARATATHTSVRVVVAN